MTDINQYLFTGARLPLDICSVGEVRVEELVGSGGFGVVCRVTDVEDNATYALKIIRNINYSDEEVRSMQLVERIRREAAVAIPSPHVIRALGIREWDDSTFLILFEFFQGRSLGELILEGASSDKQKPSVIRQILQGVADAHQCNIIHRDLKPDNVLVGQDGTVKVIDFGLAKFGNRRITTNGSYFGTLRYMAPELLLGGSHLAETQSDIYSLGHILYELVQGEHFWQHAKWRSVEDFAAYLGRVPTPAAAIDLSDFECDYLPSLKDTIHEMVRIQPEERIASVDQVLERLGWKSQILPAMVPLPSGRFHNPVLIVESGLNPHARIVVGIADGGQRVVGRNEISALDYTISRRHAEFSRKGESYFLEDVGSKNGTLLRGQLLEPGRAKEVRHGDRIKMGEVYLQFVFLDFD